MLRQGRALRLDRVEDLLQIAPAQGFLLQKLRGQRIQLVAVSLEGCVGDLVGFVEKRLHLLVDLRGDCRRVLERAATAAAGKRIALLLAVLHRAKRGGHAVLGDHRTCDLRGLLDVVRRTGGRRAEDQFLGRAAAHGEHHAGKQFVAGVHALVVLVGRHGETAGAAAGENGHLVHALDVLERPRGQRVAALVVGGDLLLVLRDDLAGSTRAADHAVRGLLQRIRGDHVAADAGGEQRGLVKHIRQVRTRHARGALGQSIQVDVLGQRLVLRVHLQNLGTAREVRVGYRNLAVETARAQKRGVQNVRTVRRSQQDHALATGEAIHLHQQLVQGLLALVVATPHAGAALAADGVDLVDKDDARSVLTRLLEQVTHTGRTDTDEHLHKVRTRNGVERHTRLTSDSTRKQGLTGTRWAIEQHTTRDLRAELFVHARVGEEVHHFVEFVDGLVGTRHVIERVGRVVLSQLLRL